ncbi:hypothetical protein JWG39_09485 [Desulforhopalus vacuolatus]|uniref:hypothetical protein n=1 Tax=Desulforhopalus vacuolatus TaxID=40414 RepID=UPI00196660A6|nr:hypothetical protein [Desulforhopalus vacuolatus]MBM9520045.1 hypothetical protein [Desulforhopalus vacuolatus]
MNKKERICEDETPPMPENKQPECLRPAYTQWEPTHRKEEAPLKVFQRESEVERPVEYCYAVSTLQPAEYLPDCRHIVDKACLVLHNNIVGSHCRADFPSMVMNQYKGRDGKRETGDGRREKAKAKGFCRDAQFGRLQHNRWLISQQTFLQ